MARKSTRTPKRKAKTPTTRKATDAAQHKRFVEMAREIGANESPEAFDRAFKKVVTPKRPSRS